MSTIEWAVTIGLVIATGAYLIYVYAFFPDGNHHRARVLTITVGFLLLLLSCGNLVHVASGHPMPKPAQEKYFLKRCDETTLKRIHNCIHAAAIHWDVSYRDGLCIASRETGPRNCWDMDPNICNTKGSGACGLFQFMPGTWAGTPYASRSLFDARWASYGWAWAYSGVGGPGWGPHHWAASA